MTNTLAEFFNTNPFRNFLIGFDKIEETINNAMYSLQKNIPKFPPYNIVKTDENTYVIEMAVAGFGKQDLEITIENGVLKVSGQSSLDTLPKDNEGKYELYKGIAERSFTRIFRLADTVIVKDAEIFNGMLKIWLEAVAKDNTSKKIEIKEKA